MTYATEFSHPHIALPSLMIEKPEATGIWELVKEPLKAKDLKLSVIDFSTGRFSIAETSATTS